MIIKKKPNKLIWLGVVCLIVALAASGYFLLLKSTDQAETEQKPEQVKVSQPEYSPTVVENCQPSADKTKPYLVTVASVGIENACVEEIGVTTKGALGDPEENMNMGWYVGSPVPAADGAGIYSCHTSFARNIKAVCTTLHDLENGAEIVVEIASGQKFIYTVKQMKEVLFTEVDMKEFDSVVGGASRGLSIMTCAGTYNQRTGDSTHRLLVWATLND